MTPQEKFPTIAKKYISGEISSKEINKAMDDIANSSIKQKNNKRVTLSQKQYNYILSESKKKVINETHSSLLYHFITPHFLVELLQRNSFKTTDAELVYKGTDNCGNERYEFDNDPEGRFLSLTRNRNPFEGFPILVFGTHKTLYDTIITRLTIDGDMLKRYSNFKDKKNNRYNVKVKPFDYGAENINIIRNDEDYTSKNGREWMMNTNEYNNEYYFNDFYRFDKPKKFLRDKENHPFSQAEDRLYTKAEYIPNANKYIKGIDIYVRENKYTKNGSINIISDNDFNIINKIYKLSQILNIPLYIYNNRDAFIQQRVDKTITYNNLVSRHNKIK